jgi:hypothetical protein
MLAHKRFNRGGFRNLAVSIPRGGVNPRGGNRRPATRDLGLEAAGIATDARAAIIVDEHLVDIS